MRNFVAILLAIFICFGGFLLIIGNKYDFTGKDINTTLNLSHFDGKYKVIYFGYTTCPDVCPAALSILSGVLDELKRDDIVVLFITLDPERDDLKLLDEYAKYFYKNSYGIVVENLEKVAKSYGVKYQKIDLQDSDLGYSVAHSSALYLLDKRGKFAGEISNLTEQNIKKQLEIMLSK